MGLPAGVVRMYGVAVTASVYKGRWSAVGLRGHFGYIYPYLGNIMKKIIKQIKRYILKRRHKKLTIAQSFEIAMRKTYVSLLKGDIR